jgi:hypothetical protein
MTMLLLPVDRDIQGKVLVRNAVQVFLSQHDDDQCIDQGDKRNSVERIEKA